MDTTPGRATVLQLGIGEAALSRQSWTLQRDAKDMRPVRALGALTTHNVFSAGGDAWLLRPQFAETVQALTKGGYVQPEDVELAPGFVSFNQFRKRTELTGNGGYAGLPATGAPAYKKRVNQAAAWNDARLDADEAALPPPPADPTQSYPLDRVMSGFETFPDNTPFALIFRTPEGRGGSDGLINFYFGGETSTIPDGTSGGQFCLAFQGGGDVRLWERDNVAGDWGSAPVEVFRWNQPGEASGGLVAALGVIPYAKGQLWFVNPGATPYSTAGFTLLGMLLSMQVHSAQQQGQLGTTNLYHEFTSTQLHRHTDFMTGAGTVRVDVQRLASTVSFSIIRGVYPIDLEEVGTLVDGAFEVNRYLPAETPIRVNPLFYRYPNTQVEVQLYNAADNTALDIHPDNPDDDHPTVFRAVLNQRKYYAVFTLKSTDGLGTPALYGYSVDIEGGFTTIPRTPLVTGRITRLAVIGPDLEPNHEGANIQLRDEIDETHVVREKDGLRTLVSVVDTGTGDVITHLLEGLTQQSPSTQRGVAGSVYPSPDWHDTNLRFSGLWPRLLEQIHDGQPYGFADSSTGPFVNIAPDPYSKVGYAPWRITDCIKWLLNHAGVPADELDVPDLPFRFWPSEDGDPRRLAIYPGTRYGMLANTLVREFLGATLLRDPNAGVRGMWRVVIPPSPLSLNILWTFSRDPCPYPGRLVTAPGAYGPGVSFIAGDTWQSTPQAPEGSTVTVWGVDGKKNLITAYIENAAAIAYFDGRRVPIKRKDASLNTQEACNWMALRLNEQGCTPRTLFDFTAPLVFVRDPQDPYQNANLLRPLRANDLIYIRKGGVDYRAILRSVNPGYQYDHHQFAHYQGTMYPA